MSFCIQDPSYKESQYLHEALIEACVDGIYGGGAYAFASKEGIELLIEDDNFKQILRNGHFLLIVGMDDITNIFSVNTLRKLRDKYSGHLTVKAYIHHNKGSIFHPKYSWFANKEGGVLVLGSGNLTQKGLRQNREAYIVSRYGREEMDEIVQEWNVWIEHSKPFLFDIDEDIVYEYAKRNTQRMKTVVSLQKEARGIADTAYLLNYGELFRGQPIDRIFGIAKKKKEEEIVNSETEINVMMYDEDLDIDLPYWRIYLNSEVMIAEIPRSGSRWQQVNFDKRTFEEFFGATCGGNGTYRILLRNMQHNGILGEAEVRPGVSVSSQNYRFELDAAKGRSYPDGKYRPLGVFVKVSSRDFIYELVMPDDKAYKDCMKVLNRKEVYSIYRMRRIRYRCREIFEDTPGLELWKRLDVEENE